MAVLEFTSNVINSIAWPAVFVTLIILLRKPIRDLIPFLEHLKYKDLEVNFRRQAEEMLISIKEEQDEPEEIKQINLKESPRASVIRAWSEIVEAADQKYEQLEPDQKLKKFGPDRALGYFIYMGLLIPETKKVIQELQSLRNQATHYSDAAISEDGAKAYVKAAEKIKKQIEAINNVSPLKLTHLAYVLFEVNAVIDTGKYDYISINDIHREIKNGTVLRYISKEAAGDIDLSPLLSRENNDLNFEQRYAAHLQSIYGGYAGQERRKWGIENKGLCLLVAWTIEIIQKGSGWQSDEDIA